MSIPQAAKDIISRAREGAPGDPASPEQGVSEAPPASTPVAETEAKPTEEPRQTEGKGDSESGQRVPIERLNKVIEDRKAAEAAKESSDAELAQLREKVAQMEAKEKLSSVVSGEGKPGNWDDLSDLQKMAWFQEQTATQPPASPQSNAADEMALKWSYLEAGFSVPQAGILHEIASSNPGLGAEDVMAIAERRAPDLFSQQGSQQGAEIPNSHAVGGPRPTRSAAEPKTDVRAEARAKLHEAMGKPRNVKGRAALDYLKAIRGK